MKRTFALAAVLALLLSGCGKPVSEPSIPAQTTTAPVQTETEAETEAETAAIPSDITGVYAEASIGKGQISIATNDNVVYFVNVSWANSAASHNEWDFIGKLDDKGELHYENCRKQSVTFNEDGTIAEGSPVVEYTDGTGFLKFTDTGLEWVDDKEGVAAGTYFTKMDSSFIEEGVVETEAPSETPAPTTAAPATVAPTAAPTAAPPQTTAKPVTAVQVVTSVVTVPVPVVPDVPVTRDVSGVYSESIAGRGTITVREIAQDRYSINVRWSSSASEYSTWEMTGFLVGNQIRYADCVLTSYALDEFGNYIPNYDGYETPYVEYDRGSGVLTFVDNAVYWDDYERHAGDECTFVLN